MKKRVAVFANGWSDDYLQEVTGGILRAAEENNADIFVFVNHSAFAESEKQNTGEANIFRLPDIGEFDGVILMANSFNSDFELNYLTEKIKETNVPAVSLEYKIDGTISIITDSYSGMYKLAEHVISEHGARHILYLGGTKEHPDSNIRMRAVTDAAAAHGIAIPEGDIIYADFSKKMALAVFTQWLDKNGELPDVIMCANDVMAMGICEWLDDHNYKVPEDVIVTGYDCSNLGQQRYPSLATVNHDWNKMGYTAMNILADKIAGKETETEIILDSEVVLGVSCGCEQDKAMYNRIIKKIKGNTIDGLLSDSHFRHIYLAVRKASDKEGLSRSFASLFEREHWMEGDDFMLCLEPEFFNIVEGDENLYIEGYSDRLHAICSLKDGVSKEHCIIDRKDAVFCKADEKEKPGIYIYVPLHSEGKIFGFAMITRDINIIIDKYLYIWTRHMIEYLEQVRNNFTIAELTKKLTELSVTDVLTGVYNRVGCDRIMYPMLENCSKQGIACSIMMVDVDRLKTINDVYGHANGDKAICTVASVLTEALPDGWIVVRFGGDEFLAGGMCANGEDVRDISDQVETKLKDEVKIRDIKFPLTVSIGSVMLEPGGVFNIEKSLTEADQHMYKIKQKHHERRLLENTSC